ncbi:hypothetical protein MMC24_001638 [Lignoscripta atroalba]|nr:hypothetical protein [Lignoscripta atroalba]
MSSVGSPVLEQGDVTALDTLTWDDLYILLEAAKNFRFCGPVATAQEIIKNGTTSMGDCLAVINGFPGLIYRLNAAKKIKAKDERADQPGPKDRNKMIDAILGFYAAEPTSKNWMNVEWAMLSMECDDKDKATIAKAVGDGILHFADIATRGGSKENSVVLVGMDPAAPMGCQDWELPLYGGLGKVGGRRLPKELFWHEIYAVRPDSKGMVDERYILGAIVKMAKAVLKAREAK